MEFGRVPTIFVVAAAVVSGGSCSNWHSVSNTAFQAGGLVSAKLKTV